MKKLLLSTLIILGGYGSAFAGLMDRGRPSDLGYGNDGISGGTIFFCVLLLISYLFSKFIEKR